MEEMGIEPIVTCTPNQHSPTISTASGNERGDLMKLRSLPLAPLPRIQRFDVRKTFRDHGFSRMRRIWTDYPL